MTPTTTGPLPEVLDEIKALFSWNPPCLIRYANKKKLSTVSITAHPPSFYNKHISSRFTLKRVVHLPSLVQDLAKNVDKALNATLTTLPPRDGFITAKDRSYDLDELDREARHERAVAIFYYMTTARYCSKVASTLALHPSASFSQWRSLLSWTQSDPSDYGIMDGLLYFRNGVDPTDKTWPLWKAIVESIENEYRRIFEEMGKSREPLAMWEIMCPNTGTAEVMNAVLNLGKFSWTFCSAHDWHSNPKHRQTKANVKLAVVGPDAQATPWSFPDDSLNTCLVPDNHNEEIDIQPLTTLQLPVTRQVTRSAASSSTLPLGASYSPKHWSPAEVKGKKRKQHNDDEAYQHRQDITTAQHLVQQAWAQAVKVDGTLIILHSGNHELVCVRHRDTQTLYVSDVIEPPTCVEPGYGKLHVGIYIAAIQDTMNRKQQISLICQPNPPCDGSDLNGDHKVQDDQDHNPGSSSCRQDGRGNRGDRCKDGPEVGQRNSRGLQRSEDRKNPTGELVAIEKTIQIASNCDMVQLYLQYDVYDSLIPASFVRSAPSIMAHTRYPTPPFSSQASGLKGCLMIVLTSEIGRGGTGVVHRGTLKPEICDGAIPLDVVVKLAFDDDQRDALQSEYEVYCRLRSKGVLRGIATVLGLFDDSEGTACGLVMLYAGVPLVKNPQRILSVSDCKSALSTLECIHRAGILHGDICPDNILMGNLGVTIIDFGNYKECNNQKAKDKEFERLRYLLDLACESH